MREESPEQRLVNDLIDWMNPPNQHSTQSNGHATSSLSDEQIIERCRAGKSAAKFSDLFDAGDVSAYDDDDSGADYALIGILKRHTRDAAQIERIMLRSPLRRPKWEENRVGKTWLRYSIDNCLDDDGSLSSSPNFLRESTDDDNNESSADDDLDGIVWFSELGEVKEREYLIESVAVKGYTMVAYGAGGVAKSFAVLSAGIAIAGDAQEWLGLSVLDHGPVLYADFELDVDEQQRRVRDLCNGLGVEVPKKLAYLSCLDLTTEEAFRKIRAFVKKYRPLAVIIDSMGLAMSGDMDKAKDVIAFHRRYTDGLRALGTTPFVVDHEGKLQHGENRKEKGPTGSAFKSWTARSVLQFILEEYDEENSALDIRVRQHKTNFKPTKPFGVRFTFEDKKVSIESIELDDSDLLDETYVPVRDRILAALKPGEATIKELASLTFAEVGTIRNKLSELMKDQKVADAGYRGREKLYALVTAQPPKTTTEHGDTGDSLLSSSPEPYRENTDDDNKQARTTNNKEAQARGAGLQDFFASPPSWLPTQLAVFRQNPQRHLKPLCVSIAAEVLGDGLRWEEVKEDVLREVGPKTRRVHIPTERKEGRPYEEPDIVYGGHEFKRGPYYNFEESEWANPHYKLKDVDREKCLALYREHILNTPELLSCLEELRGKTIGCFCPLDQECHVDILIELLEQGY